MASVPVNGRDTASTVVRRAFAVGDTIIRASPQIHVLKTEYKGKRCDHCYDKRFVSLQLLPSCLVPFHAMSLMHSL